MDKPWFKLFAADVLLDSKLDAIPPEAEGLVFRMWCVCHIDGKCPADPKELARKTRRSLEYVLQYKSHCESFFELHEGFYYSHRMEREKKRGDINRGNAVKRWNKTTSEIRNANGNANNSDLALRRSDYDYDSDFDVDLNKEMEGKIREIAALHPKVRDVFHLPNDVATAIAEAIARDSWQVVWAGTKAYSEVVAGWAVSDRHFAIAATRFYRQSEYRTNPEEWKGNSNGQGKQPARVSASRERSERSKRNILDGFAANARRADPSV